MQLPNGLRYLRWGGDGEAVQPEKSSGVGNCLGCAQNPQRQVHALLGSFLNEVQSNFCSCFTQEAVMLQT